MKRIYLLLLIACGLLGANPARAQLSGGDSLRQKLITVFAPLDKSQVPTGYLYEAGIRLLEPRFYNGVLSDSNLTDLSVLRYLRAGLGSARVHGPDTLPGLDAYNARVRAAEDATAGAVPLTVQYVPYATIRPDALERNLLTVQNDQLHDVPGRPQSPYLTTVLFAAAPARSFARSNTVSFLFRRNLYLSGSGAVPSALYLDFGDGNGYRPAAWGQPLSNTYATAGTKRIKVKFVYQTSFPIPTPNPRQSANRQVLPGHSETRESWFDFEVMAVTPAARTTGTYDTELPFNPSTIPGYEHSGGTVFVLYGTTGGVKHTQLTKPFIISEGYNLYDTAPNLRACNNPNNTIEDFLGKIDISFLSPSGAVTGNFKNNLLAAGYDVVYIDNAKGADDIIRNAHLFEAVVRWVNQSKAGTTDNVVMGQSMGGLVARYGLAEMTRRVNDDPHTRLLVLHDSPQRGANNPLGLQSLTRSTDVPWLTIPFFGDISMASLSPKLSDALTVLEQPATRQLSILLANDGRGSITANTFIDAYHQVVDNVPGAGYNVIAVSDGSQCGIAQNTPPHVALSTATSNLFARPLPYLGRFSIEVNMAAYGLPAYGQRAELSHARVSLRYSLCIGKGIFRVCIPIGRYYLLNESAQSPANTLPYETLPGGNTNLYTEAGSCANGFDLGGIPGIYSAFLNTNLYNGNICFVPSYSALDVPTVTSATAFAKYINNTTTGVSFPGVAPFQAISAGEGYNRPHIGFTPRNSEWIFNEMQQLGHPCTPADNECNPSDQATITGPTALCPGGFGQYAINNLPAGYTVAWQVSGGATPTSGTGPAFAFTAPGTPTSIQLTATISNACTSRSISLSVHVGGGQLSISGPSGVECYYSELTYQVASSSLVQNVATWHVYFDNDPTPHDEFILYDYGTSVVVKPTTTGNMRVEAVADDICQAGITVTAQITATIASQIPNPRIGQPPLYCPIYRPGPARAAAYPNPADAVLNLAAPETPTATAGRTAVLYNAQGREVRRLSAPQAAQFSTAGLPEGIYYLLVEQNGRVTRSQIQVKH